MYTNDTYRRLTYKWERPCEKPADYSILLEYADRLQNLEDLIVDGRVKFLPCRLGQTVYFVNKYRIRKQIEPYVVDAITLTASKIKIDVHQTEPPYLQGTVFGDSFGTQIFTTKEAAEEALEEVKE